MLKDNTYISQAMTSFAKEIANKTDYVIKAAFAEKGFSVEEEFVKENISRIIYEGDNFDHIWYHFGQPDAVRIISIERHPNTSLFDATDSCKIKWELRYY